MTSKYIMYVPLGFNNIVEVNNLSLTFNDSKNYFKLKLY